LPQIADFWRRIPIRVAGKRCVLFIFSAREIQTGSRHDKLRMKRRDEFITSVKQRRVWNFTVRNSGQETGNLQIPVCEYSLLCLQYKIFKALTS
tara:strand:+ start:116119 stop:116400 length:282 start_codon:yes stop_codon:yes gene_type:complete